MKSRRESENQYSNDLDCMNGSVKKNTMAENTYFFLQKKAKKNA